MTPAYLNLSASPSLDQDDHLHHSSIFSSNNYQATSSCSYIITRNFFDSASTRDQSEIFRQDIQQPQFQQDLADNLVSSRGEPYDIENESSDNGLKFSIWKKEEKYENEESSYCEIKWMSPKMRWMNKMKKDVDYATPSTTNTLIKLEDHKHQPSSAIETENTSIPSSNSTISNPIRTCSDCNTTKTPLWRSGPQGPKSLCNACGIRQRKARRAMAAAANDAAFEKETTPRLVIKTIKYDKMKTKTKQQKDKTSGRGVNVAKFNKRSCSNVMTIDGHESAQNKVCFEEFLLTLTNNLACHDQVFPQDEKDAAILLMAMSLHLAHRDHQ